MSTSKAQHSTAQRRVRTAAVVLTIVFGTVPAISIARDPAYRVPRLSDGRPDLQARWDHIDAAPLERMPAFESLVITQAQAHKIEAALGAMAEDRSTPTEPTEFFNERLIYPIGGELRSSVIIDPPNGQLPWRQSLAQWGAKTRRAVVSTFDGPEQRPTSERCLGNPASQPPHLYNPGTNLHQIIQTRDTVVFMSEWGHDARIIRLNSQHAPAALTSWLGDSIGWWEGDTLVVETTNFSPTDSARLATPNAFLISTRAKVIERFTRTAHDELNYLFSVEDPDSYAQTWKGETHFARTDDEILEYACHEDNRSMVYILQGAREQERHPPRQ